MKGSEHTAQNERAIQGRLEFAEQTLQWHEVIVGWIERQRVKMNSRPLTPVKETDDQNTVLNAVSRVSTRQRQSRQPDISTVRGKVRVSKSTPKNRNMRTQTFKASKTKPVIVDSDVTTRIQQMPKRQETKPPCAKEKQLGPLGQLRPQRVSKSNRFAATGTKSWPRIRCHGNKLAFGAAETQNEKISRPPTR